ncbi:MAG: S8 family serine peptidase [Nocardioidaceae bacterium]
MRRLLMVLAVALALATPVSPAIATSKPPAVPAPGQTGLYVVVLNDAPLATYKGGVRGYSATAPRPGQRFDADRPAVTRYRDYLLSHQAQVLWALGSPQTVYRYTTALDGFAAELDNSQVKQLQSMPHVLNVELSTLHKLDATSRTVGASREIADVRARGGHDEVIGVIDSGIWPENPSFAGLPIDRGWLAHSLPGFTGRCEAGEQWTAAACNSKIVAARYFVKGFGVDHLSGAEFTSPRDGSGHGSHTAATAAGNSGVAVEVQGQQFGHVSGMAPSAHLAIYKACWAAPDPSGDGCTTADTLKAVDQAVSDGVNVISYSVSGEPASYTSAMGLAFLNAAASGVFVATSAGDEGPRRGTVDHPSPWVTTVAASQHDLYQGTVRLGDGQTFTGAMVSGRAVHRSRLVLAGRAARHDISTPRAALCYPGSLSAQKVEGAIVVCERGDVARVVKSATVAQAGGVGMVLVNTTQTSTDADFHSVPTVHLDSADGKAVLGYAAKAGVHARASLTPDGAVSTAQPELASFSSRGPSLAGNSDVLKPDLVAPGVGVLAAVAPPSDFGRLWDLYSGTSMSAPYIAGLAAIIKSAHPRWTPAMMQSAMMTTATRLPGVRTPLAQGAGEVNPQGALDPGLVYNAGEHDWLGFLRGQGLRLLDGKPLSHVRPLDASDLNLPSIAIGDLIGEQTITRTVTNVSRQAETYVADYSGLHGIAVSVSPGTLSLAPGQSARFRVSFSPTKHARYEHFADGSLIWSGSLGHTVASPITIRPVAAGAPSEVQASGSTGSVTILAEAGVTGTIAPRTSGLVGARPELLTLTPGSFNPADPRVSASTAAKDYQIPAGTAVARFEVAPVNESDDVAAYVYRGDQLVASATGPEGSSDLTLSHPRPGSYRVFVHAQTSSTDASMQVSFTGWVVPAVGSSMTRPNLVLSPNPVTVTGGENFRVVARWSGLDPNKRWLGFVSYTDTPHVTYVTLN